MNKITLFEQTLPSTPITQLSGDYGKNNFFIKRDDMIPFSFGGNKARKAAEFYKEIQKVNADIVMTYGSNSSNHCRIIANMAASLGIDCHIISPEEQTEILYNTKLVENFGSVIERCSVNEVAQTIDNRIKKYGNEGKKVYFITGGGHGDCGTHAYVKAYNEIVEYEKSNNLHFDYIFHASGTGTTQAGLVCGQILANDVLRKIVGISIARDLTRGREVVKESIKNYLGNQSDLFQEDMLEFVDSYRFGGYGKYNSEIEEIICKVMRREGIPMDTTYVGKAFYGMIQYLAAHQISEKNILFIHTGGTPLFFDYLDK